jgi:ATP-dependent DNA helicase RecQ
MKPNTGQPRKSFPSDNGLESGAILSRASRIKRFRPGQKQIIEAVRSSRDVLGLMPTGGGKSLTFQLPAMLLPHTTVVVSPLISLMQDQVEKAEEAEIAAAKLNSTLTALEEKEAEEDIAEGLRKQVYVTPEKT